MAYTMTHIYIAEAVAERLGEIKDYPTYILGSIAPDAVHASDTYVVSDKERSHLFVEGLHWGKVSNSGHVDLWENSIKAFKESVGDKYDKDFVLGYLVHLYTDVYSSMNFFYPFMCSIKGDFDKEREHFLKENFGYNYYLYREFNKRDNLKAILNSAKAITLDGIIDKEIIESRIKKLFEQEFVERDISDIDEYTICTHEAMDKLIKSGSDYAIEKLC